MLYKQAANIAQRVWSSLRKTVPGLPKRYTGKFNSVLPLPSADGKGVSRLYNKGIGSYKQIGESSQGVPARWVFTPKGSKTAVPLPLTNETLLVQNLKKYTKFKDSRLTTQFEAGGEVGASSQVNALDELATNELKYRGQNAWAVPPFPIANSDSIPNASVGDSLFMSKLRTARLHRKLKEGKLKNKDFNYMSVKQNIPLKIQSHEGSSADVKNLLIKWTPDFVSAPLDRPSTFLRLKTPLFSNSWFFGNRLMPADLTAGGHRASFNFDTLLHEANHIAYFKDPAKRIGSWNKRLIAPDLWEKNNRRGIDSYTRAPVEVAQYSLQAKEGIAALKNAPIAQIPEAALPARRIAEGVDVFRSSPQELLKTVDKMYDLPLQSLLSVGPQFTRSVLATANTRLRATDAARRLNLQRQLAQVKHNNVSKALNLLEEWKVKGIVKEPTYIMLHNNLKRMGKQLTQGTNILKDQTRELQGINRRYRKMFKDASYTRAVWDRIPSHFIEKV